MNQCFQQRCSSALRGESEVSVSDCDDEQLATDAVQPTANAHHSQHRAACSRRAHMRSTAGSRSPSRLFRRLICAAFLCESEAAPGNYQAAGCHKRHPSQAASSSTTAVYAEKHSFHPGAPRCAAGHAVAAVRCCGENRQQCTSPCGPFATGSNLSCARATLRQATQACKREGLQLCSRAELHSGRCCKKGCTADQQHVWTRETCEIDPTCPVPWLNDASMGCDAPGIINSQYLQAQYVLQLLDLKRGGFFTELAANHPTHNSNSRTLERDFGWRGVCVEGNPAYIPALRAVRSCTVIEAVVANDDVMVRFADAGVAGGIVTGGGIGDGGDGGGRAVVARTLASIFREVAAPDDVDYFSLDVEGAEEAVMSTFPHNATRIRVMTVEKPSAELAAALRQRHGLRRVCLTGAYGDELWAHNRVLAARPRLLSALASQQEAQQCRVLPEDLFGPPLPCVK